MTRLLASLLHMAGVMAVVASLSGSAFAQESGGGSGFPPGLAEARLIKEKATEIGVGEETLKKLEKIVTETKAKEEEQRTKTAEARNVTSALLEVGRPDEEKLLAAVAATSAVTRQTRELSIKTSLQIRALLKDEQLAKFMEIRRKAMAARRKRGGRPNVRR